ncbi:MAG: hypothetical protein Tsb0034_24850 [Ekhidna sp.]
MRGFLLLLLLSLISDSLWHEQIVYALEIQAPNSEIVGTEDLMGRWEYEQMLTADPQTGKVPENILKAERAFARKLELRTSRSRVSQLSYEAAGPFNVGGRTRAVAFDVRDEQVILAGGVSGGIWKSIDGGSSWVRKSDPENRNSVTCLVQDTRPGKEDIWYHGTGEIVGNSARGGGAPFRGNGIYKSTDNGESWFPLLSTQDSDPQVFNSQFQYIWNIVVNTENPDEDEVLVAAYGGILRSVDGGETWELEIGQELFNLPDFIDLNESTAPFYTSISQSANGTFYATLSTQSSSDQLSAEGGIYISADGREWENISPPEEGDSYRRIVIGNSLSNPETTYFLVDSGGVVIVRHDLIQFDENDTIQTFEVRNTPSFETDQGAFNTQGSYNMMIRVHPQNPNIVFAGGTNLYRSTDGFATSENIDWVGGYNPNENPSVYPNHHPDQHDLLFYPSNPNRVLSASDGGLIVSLDGTADSVSWQSMNNGFITSQFYTIAQSKIDNDPTLIGGMQDNGTDLTTSAGLSSWRPVINGDGSYAATTNNNSLWYASFQRGQILRLTFDDDYRITSFGRVDPEGLVRKAGSAFLFITPFVLDPLNQNRMFLAGGNHLYFNGNVTQIPGGSQIPTSLGWEQITEAPLAGGVYSALEMSWDGQVLYFGSSAGQVFKLTNNSQSFNFQIEEITASVFPANAYVSCISVNPENRDHLLVIFSNYEVHSIFESTDGGESFVNVSGNLEEFFDGTGAGPSVRWGELIPTTAGVKYFVGTSAGLYATEGTNGPSTTWIKESTDKLGSAVIPMMDYRPGDGRLVIATHGNGVFTTQIPDFKRIAHPSQEGSGFQLLAAYPNPFEDGTKIRFEIPQDDIVRIDVFSSKGEFINNLLWAPQFAGVNEISWDGTNTSGTSLSNGIYFYRIQYRDKMQSGRLILRR